MEARARGRRRPSQHRAPHALALLVAASMVCGLLEGQAPGGASELQPTKPSGLPSPVSPVAPPERWIDLFRTPRGFGVLLDRVHRGVSNSLVDTVEAIDRFFGAERLEGDPRVAQVRVRATTTFGERGEIAHAIRTRARIPFPRTERRLQLIFADLDEDDANRPGPAEETIEDREAFAGLGVALAVGRRFFGALEVGGKLRSEFEPEVRLRFQGRHGGERWGVRITETVLWNEEEEFAQVTRASVERALTPTAFLRAFTRAEWGETTRGVELDTSFGTGVALTERWALGVDLAQSMHTRPSGIVDEWRVVTRLRRQLHPRGVFLELAPVARFPRERAYEFTPEFQVAVEIFFGGSTVVTERAQR